MKLLTGDKGSRKDLLANRAKELLYIYIHI